MHAVSSFLNVQPDKNRFTMFPIRHHDLYNFYKASLKNFWVVEEINFADDVKDWRDKLNQGERDFVLRILAFFAGSDGIVGENLALNFYNDVEMAEARAFYACQLMIEQIHSETYSMMIDVLVSDVAVKHALFNAVNTDPIIRMKADFALEWMDKTRDFPQRLLAFILFEGLFFSGSFCAIFWLKSRGLMPGLGTSNEFISRDEGMHAEFGITLFNKYIRTESKPSQETVHRMFKSAVDIEHFFITQALDVSLIGMNAGLMKQYICFVADRLLKSLSYEPLFNEPNPFPFMEQLSLQGKTNFFEKKVTDYSRSIQVHVDDEEDDNDF